MDKFNITYKNKVVGRINSALVEKQNLSDVTLDEIKFKHGVKRFLMDLLAGINIKNNPKRVKILQNGIMNIEYELQDLWGFPRDIKFHKFWELPQCRCPKMDNEDSYPSGYYVINELCPLHGVPDDIYS